MHKALYIDPYPDDELMEFLAEKFELTWVKDAPNAVLELKEKGFDLIVLEVMIENGGYRMFRDVPYWRTGLKIIELLKDGITFPLSTAEPTVIVVSCLALAEGKEEIRSVAGRQFSRDSDYDQSRKFDNKIKLRYARYFEKPFDHEEVIDSIRHYFGIY